MEIRCNTVSDMPKAAAAMLQFIGDAPQIVLLRGDLGAGKTSLTKALCNALGTTDSATSPTFSLVNEYRLEGGLIYHIDLYRLEDLDEAINIGIEEYLYSGNWCFIEWPDVLKPLIEEPYVTVDITAEENAERIFRILKFPTDPKI